VRVLADIERRIERERGSAADQSSARQEEHTDGHSRFCSASRAHWSVILARSGIKYRPHGLARLLRSVDQPRFPDGSQIGHRCWEPICRTAPMLELSVVLSGGGSRAASLHAGKTSASKGCCWAVDCGAAETSSTATAAAAKPQVLIPSWAHPEKCYVQGRPSSTICPPNIWTQSCIPGLLRHWKPG
jgi:hypothetical protein